MVHIKNKNKGFGVKNIEHIHDSWSLKNKVQGRQVLAIKIISLKSFLFSKQVAPIFFQPKYEYFIVIKYYLPFKSPIFPEAIVSKKNANIFFCRGEPAQSAFTGSKLTKETLEQGVKYVQS